MALKGKPRDVNRWREALLDPNVHFPGESGEYRRARNELLEAEAELRRLNEQVAAQRRALPAGGLIREDYVFESAVDGSNVRLSELFAPGKNSLVIYNMMFPRWSQDPRASAPGGRTAELPLVEQPCTLKPSQTHLKFQLARARCSSFCVGYPRMARVRRACRSTKMKAAPSMR